MKEIIEKLKLIKKQPYDRHLEIYLGKSYLDSLLVKFGDKHIIEENNKNEIIDLVIDTIIKYFEKNGEIVKTKFGLHEYVWLIDCVLVDKKPKWVVSKCFQIEKIVCICSYDEGFENYYTALKSGIKEVEEQNCFATQAEAQVECDRRNNEK